MPRTGVTTACGKVLRVRIWRGIVLLHEITPGQRKEQQLCFSPQNAAILATMMYRAALEAELYRPGEGVAPCQS